MEKDTMGGAMQTIIGTCDRVLEVDLSSKRTRTISISPEERRLYLGGKGLALWLLAQRIHTGIDPLSEENILVVMTGALTGTNAPCSGRFAAVTKSPLTGLMSSSSCGGPFGTALKSAGWDGVLLRGACEEPTLLEITPDGVCFETARHLWGKDTVDTQEALSLRPRDGALVIGPAGENLVRYANIASGHRFFGRGGFGAVMGSKKLKAVLVRRGPYRVQPADPEAFKTACRKATLYIHRNRFTGHLYRRYGTASHVNLCQDGGILPIRNFKDGRHSDASRVSGQAMRRRFGAKPSTCRPCTILCGHRGVFSDGITRQLPEYETVGLLGTNLGVFDPNAIARWNELCSRLGLDTISCGGVLAYVMEAGERGLLETPLRFGSADGVEEAIHSIAYRQGFGEEMAEGTRRLAQRYGGKDFAMDVKGLELPAYDPRGSWGQGLAYAVANRGGCHLSATLFPLEVFLNFLTPHSIRGKARFVRFFESLYAAMNSLQTCVFTTYAFLLEAPVARFSPRPILAATMRYAPPLALALMDVGLYARLFQAASGHSMSQRRLLEAGDRIVVLERALNVREGITRKDDTLPERLLREGRDSDPEQRTVPLEPLLDGYYALRGYNRNGIPLPRTLRRLQIPEERVSSGAYVPERRQVQTRIIRTVFWILGRALQSASRIDAEFRKALAAWPEGFTILFKIQPFGPRMGLVVDRKKRLRFRGDTLSEHSADLVIGFKNMDTAYRMLTARMGTAEAFARNRISISGDLALAMRFTRLLGRIQVLLYPRWIVRRLLKGIPPVPPAEKYWKRIWLYSLGIPFGL